MNEKIGKRVAESIYVHQLALSVGDGELSELVQAAIRIAPIEAAVAKVFKIDAEARVVSLLDYPQFFDQAFPELSQSWRIYLDDSRVAYRSFAESLNPPILHRKELLLPAAHDRQPEFRQLTEQAEQLGLFAEAHLIGFKRTWEERGRRAGYAVIGHTFQPLGNDTSDVSCDDASEEGIQRHRTALSRTGLSAPMQALVRSGLLSPDTFIFDYGCGRGDDLAALAENGIEAAGWDPHYAPDRPILDADIVNLGFVINVIEEFDERVEALQRAYELARRLLVVSTMLYGGAPPPGRPFRDGYLTQRNTFQKYFTQAELKEFIETVLDTEGIPVAPGIIFVFRDKQEEQRFLYGRQRNHHSLRLLGYRRERQARIPRPPRETRIQKLLTSHGDLVEAVWTRILGLGRMPAAEEFERSVECISVFGSWQRALRFVTSINDPAELEMSARQHREDLIVYLALAQFARRKRYRDLEASVQRDIKVHFGDLQRANVAAEEFLLKAANPADLDHACEIACAKGVGHYAPSEYLQLHVSLIERLPAVLRIYVGCGSMLLGELEGADLVKIHIRSGKLTFMRFDDFAGSPLPRMLERTKVKLREQDIDFFLYGSFYEPPLLYFKSRYINEDFPKYAEQLMFDEALSELDVVGPELFGPSAIEFESLLRERRLEVTDFKLGGSQEIPKLDERCGQNFTYRDFIECGETWYRTRIDNVPRQAETYNALHALAVNLLDPIIDYFGMLRLTYGFASAALSKRIPRRISPKLDQHAAHELNSAGRPICPRLGAAVDFLIEDEDMLEVAKWITANLPFDRLYIYGPSRPLHVSYGLQISRQVSLMLPATGSGQLVPRTISCHKLEALDWPS